MKEDVLPEGWEYKSILSLIPKDGIISDGDWIESKDQDVNGDVRLIQLADIGDGEFKNKSRRYLTSEKAKELNCTYLKPNDILIARMPDPIGRACVFPEIGQKSVTAVDICIIRLGERPVILAELLVYWVNSSFIRNQMNSEATGTTRKRITRKKLEQFKIPLPPLPEQQYLSQKLTALLDEVAQTKQRLEAIPALLKQFRQSVLADAVSGRLTEIAPKMTKMSDIAKFQNGFAFNSEDFSKSGEWQVFRLGNIRDGFLFYENKPVFISEKLAKTQEKFIPKVGDSLISMTGTRFKQDYGFACIVEKDEKILVNQRVGRIIPIKDKIIPKFLNLSLRSEHFRQQFFKGETGGVNQGNVGSKHIMSISINLPTLEQQTQIVQKVETYFALADEIEAQVNAALENANLLTQSILAKAFSGELSAAWRNSKVTETQGNV